MREIKFRAWYKCAKEMLEVSEIKLLTEPYMHLKSTVKSPIHYLGAGDNCELMQYTGLKDKKGQEIYEGDIINIYGEVRIIEYRNAWWCALTVEEFYEMYEDQKDVLPAGFGTMQEDTQMFKPVYRYGDSLDVIGNIYENPELVKG